MNQGSFYYSTFVAIGIIVLYDVDAITMGRFAVPVFGFKLFAMTFGGVCNAFLNFLLQVMRNDLRWVCNDGLLGFGTLLPSFF